MIFNKNLTKRKVSPIYLQSLLFKLQKAEKKDFLSTSESSENLYSEDAYSSKTMPNYSKKNNLNYFLLALTLLVVQLAFIIPLNAQMAGENEKAQAPTENNVLWSYDALALKMKGDIAKAATQGRFKDRVALVSLALFEGTLDAGEEKYLLNMLEGLDHSSRLYYFVRSIEELEKTRIGKDGKLARNISIPPNAMATLAKNLDAEYFAQVGVIKKGRRLQLNITIYETATQTTVWSHTWSVLRDEKKNFVQLNTSVTIDNLYTMDVGAYMGRNILNIGHFGLEVGLNLSIINANYNSPNLHVLPGVRIGGVLAFSLIQSFIDNFDALDMFFQVRPGFNIGYVVLRKYTPTTTDASSIKTELSVPAGFSFLIKDFFVIGVEVDFAHFLTKRKVPLKFAPVLSFGFKF